MITDHKLGITRDLFIDPCSSVIERSVDAYGNTLIFTGPGPDGVWFTNDDVQSNYGANDIIYCGYRFDPETVLYHVRNRTYSPVLGRWLQRDPLGYAGGVNLYEYVGGRVTVEVDTTGLRPSNNICHAACHSIWLNCTVFGGEVGPEVCAAVFFACILVCDVPPVPKEPPLPNRCPPAGAYGWPWLP